MHCEYLERITKYVISLGKVPMVWEGFSAKGAERIPKETVVLAMGGFALIHLVACIAAFRGEFIRELQKRFHIKQKERIKAIRSFCFT